MENKMPYLTFAKQVRSGQPSHDYDELLESYRNRVIHGSRTLDEFYYHFDEDTELADDMRRRNEDQVVSKEIYGSTENEDSWTLLRVDQLWLWVIDESELRVVCFPWNFLHPNPALPETIITSSTHRVDDAEDPVVRGIINYLSKEPDRGKRQHQPDSAYKMARFMVDFCIGFYDRHPEIEGLDEKTLKTSLSARQIFLDAVNKSVCQSRRPTTHDAVS